MAIFKTFIYALMFVVCIGICYLIVFITNKLPGQHGVIHVNRSSGNGTIYRLLDGIPHVHADSLEMGSYSLGFAMASDRIFHMDKLRRIAQGRLSEIFGDKTIEIDKALRNFGLRTLSQFTYQNFDQKTKDIFTNFTSGVNDYLEYFSVGIEYWLIGTEFEEWTPEDSVSIYLFMTLAMTEGTKIETIREHLFDKLRDADLVDQILPVNQIHELNISQPIVTDQELKDLGLFKEYVPPMKTDSSERKPYTFIENNHSEELKFLEDISKYFSSSDGASNCWAISSDYTKSGKPILSSDPHLDTSMPSLLYLAELNIKDEFLIGSMMPGLPFFISGRNNHVAFGPTALMADISDLFEEKIEGDKYLFKDEWKKLDIHEEIINVKNSDPVKILIRVSHHGPILDHVGSMFTKVMKQNPPLLAKVPLAFSWVPYHTSESLLNKMPHMLKVKTVQELMTMIRGVKDVSYGVCMADDQNNIGWMALTGYPIRGDESIAESRIKEGWSGKHEWTSFVPEDKLPYLLNPKKGFVFSSNGRVSSKNTEFGVGASQSSNARAFRINHLISELIKKQKVDANDMRKIMGDVYDVYASLKTPLLLKIIEKDNLLDRYITNQKVRKQVTSWIDDLKKWNYTFDKELKQPTIFSLWEFYIVDHLFKAQIQDDYLRRLPSRYFGYDDFLIKLYEKLDRDPSYFSEYCQADTKLPNACGKMISEGLQFVYNYLVPEGTTLKDEDVLYKKWHTIDYEYQPFSSTFLRMIFDKQDSSSGSKHTVCA